MAPKREDTFLIIIIQGDESTKIVEIMAALEGMELYRGSHIEPLSGHKFLMRCTKRWQRAVEEKGGVLINGKWLPMIGGTWHEFCKRPRQCRSTDDLPKFMSFLEEGEAHLEARKKIKVDTFVSPDFESLPVSRSLAQMKISDEGSSYENTSH